VFEARSAVSGRIRVVDAPRERRLVVAGDTLSAMPLDGDWTRLRREYWWQALTAVPLPPRPRVLFVGLGGGTQLHLLTRLTRPRAIAVIERDEAILRVARDWFGLGALGGVEYLCGAAETIVPWLGRARRSFDYVMEDAAYAEAPERGQPLALALAGLVARDGVLVLNRHRRTDAAQVAALLAPRFARIVRRRVRRSGDNVLVCCIGARVAPGGAGCAVGRGAARAVSAGADGAGGDGEAAGAAAAVPAPGPARAAPLRLAAAACT